jgi:hypothetical protein
VALYASLSNILGVSQSSRSTVLEKVRLLSHATIEGRGGTRCAEELAGAEGSVGNEKSKGDDRGRSPRVMRDKKSIYICLHVTLAIVEVRRHVRPESCGSWPPK